MTSCMYLTDCVTIYMCSIERAVWPQQYGTWLHHQVTPICDIFCFVCYSSIFVHDVAACIERGCVIKGKKSLSLRHLVLIALEYCTRTEALMHFVTSKWNELTMGQNVFHYKHFTWSEIVYAKRAIVTHIYVNEVRYHWSSYWPIVFWTSSIIY